MAESFSVGNTYSFNTLAPSLLGATFVNAKVIGIIGYDLAVTFTNVDLKQRAIYPLLPQGTVSDPKKYNYILFQTQSNINVVLALEWIDQNTIESVDLSTLEITVPNVSYSDSNKIREMLSLLGFSNFTIQVK